MNLVIKRKLHIFSSLKGNVVLLTEELMQGPEAKPYLVLSSKCKLEGYGLHLPIISTQHQNTHGMPSLINSTIETN